MIFLTGKRKAFTANILLAKGKEIFEIS